jgi:hypothetical protein
MVVFQDAAGLCFAATLWGLAGSGNPGNQGSGLMHDKDHTLSWELNGSRGMIWLIICL